MARNVAGNSRRHPFLLLGVTTAFFTGLVLFLHLTFVPYQRLEWQVRDSLVTSGKLRPVNPDVVVLAIDEASISPSLMEGDFPSGMPPMALELIGNGWPWSRAVYPFIIEKLINAGAKVVALDLMFPTARDGDEQLRAAVEKYGNKVVLGGTFGEMQDASGERAPFTGPSESILGQTNPHDPRIGFVNFRADSDGRVRQTMYRASLLDWAGIQTHDAPEPPLFSLAGRMAQKAGFESKLPQARQPVMFRYAYPTPPHSLYEIFVPRLWENTYQKGAFFKDKIVLIGPYGNWIKDVVDTPFGLKPGPEVHVTALTAALAGDFLHETSTAENVALISGAGLCAGLLGLIRSVLRRGLLLFGLALGFLGLALLLYNSVGFFPILLSPLLTMSLSGATYLGVERLVEYRERLRVRRTLERLVSRDVVKELLDNQESYLNTLGGQRRRVTILFSDVRGFTTLTETAVPEQLVQQLREYFTEMVRIVFAHVGTLDKFIGDAVMANWGAFDTTSRGPGPDACQAVQAALDMQRALPKLNASWKQRGFPDFKVGIGLNHGEAICAQIGSEEKQEFTAIGDTVNLASRLEGATKTFHVPILIGEAVAELVREQFALRSVDFLRVKGKTRPVEVFTVFDPREPAESYRGWLTPYEEGLRKYRTRDYTGALADFERAAVGAPDDWLNQEYVRRCRDFLQNPPAFDWDGVYTMKDK